MNTTELQKGDWVRLKPGLNVGRSCGALTLFDFMVFSGIRQIEEVESCSNFTSYKVGKFHYTAEMLEIVTRDRYMDPLLQSAKEALNKFKSYSCNSAIISKEKDTESSSLNLIVNKNKKKVRFNFNNNE